MAGFFGFFDYTKPGPGIPKDAPPKPPIVVFFGIYTRKFWNLLKINLMFNLFNLPAVIAVIFASMYVIQGQIGDDPAIDLLIRFILGSIILCIPLITVGPVQAGYTYILRNYSREEHAFLWWDFKDSAIENFKQSLIISIIDFFALIIFGIVINFYFSLNVEDTVMAMFSLIARTFIILAFIVYLMMHMYIYPMLVTFKLTIKQLYRNAFIFSMAKFFPNLGILLLCIALILLSFCFNVVIGIILFLFITVSTIGLITNFYVYPKLKKYMIDKIEVEEDDEDDEYGEDDESDEGEDTDGIHGDEKAMDQKNGIGEGAEEGTGESTGEGI
ncbi:MAG: YesL family protein [Clostridiaceae bacterium]|nr:YesL family protein [Clostridiaceae bacterium]